MRLTILLMIALLLVTDVAQAGGFSITIFGGRRTGMMTNLAAPDDVTALFHNPAGLADLKGTQLHLSGSLAFLNTGFSLQSLDPVRFPALYPNGVDCDGTEEVDDDGTASCPNPVAEDGYYADETEPLATFGILPYVGISQNLGVFSDALDGLTVSLAATAPNLYGANLPPDGPTSYFFVEGYFITIATILGAGWRVNDWFAVGANVSYNYFQLKYSQRFSLADMLRGDEPTFAEEFEADFGQAHVGDIQLDYTGVDHGLGWTLSILLNPTDWLAFGATYSGATSPTFEGAVAIDEVDPVAREEKRLEEVMEFASVKLPHSLLVEQGVPHTLQFGINLTPTPWLDVGIDARFWLYNFLGAQNITPQYDDTVEGDEAISADALSKPKDYSVSYELGIGVLVRPIYGPLPQFELMMGFAYDRSPIPDETFSIDSPTMDQWNLAAGIRYRSHGPGVSLALTYQYIAYIPRDITTSQSSPPMNARVKGHSHLPRLEFEYAF